MRASIGYRPALDGLRAVAVGVVVADHAGVGIPGSYGVTAFFVVSGYLITALLLAEQSSNGRVSLRGFYRRRFARLAPALVAVLAASVAWLIAIGGDVRRWWSGLVGALTYTTDLFESVPAHPRVSHYFEWSWSLSTEEQFYLAWPVLLIAMLAAGGRRGRAIAAVTCVAAIGAAWVARAGMVAVHASSQRISFAFASHVDALAWGALIAIVLGGSLVRNPRRAHAVLLAAAPVALFCLGAVDPVLLVAALAGDAAHLGVAAVVSMAVVATLVCRPRGLAARVLAIRPLVHLGKLSYALYLWNMLVRSVWVHVVGTAPVRSGVAALIWLASLLAVAELSYWCVERPLRRRLARSRAPSLPETDAAADSHPWPLESAMLVRFA